MESKNLILQMELYHIQKLMGFLKRVKISWKDEDGKTKYFTIYPRNRYYGIDNGKFSVSRKNRDDISTEELFFRGQYKKSILKAGNGRIESAYWEKKVFCNYDTVLKIRRFITSGKLVNTTFYFENPISGKCTTSRINNIEIWFDNYGYNSIDIALKFHSSGLIGSYVYGVHDLEHSRAIGFWDDMMENLNSRDGGNWKVRSRIKKSYFEYIRDNLDKIEFAYIKKTGCHDEKEDLLNYLRSGLEINKKVVYAQRGTRQDGLCYSGTIEFDIRNVENYE